MEVTNPVPLLTIIRKRFTKKSIIGELLIGFDHECYTIEPPVLPDDRGISAIPVGRYELALYNSAKNHGLVPLLLNVPGREYIEIHVFNRPRESEGCIGVGKSLPAKEQDLILESRMAFRELMAKIEPMFKKGKVYLEITEQKEAVV